MTTATKAKTRPYPDFPLFPHATGQWAKKIRGKIHYFGADTDKALEKYLAQRDDLQAGRTPRVQKDGLTMAGLSNHFLTAKTGLVNAGELSPLTFRDNYRTCAKIINTFGGSRLVIDLAADDFDRLRGILADRRGPVALGNEIQRVRSVFKYAFDAGLIDRPVRFGPTFKKPNRRKVRQARHAAGSRMIEARELRKILKAAKQPLKAMILLGLNCGFGQSDVATLPLAAVDLKAGWIDFPRPKTGVARRCPLWPETVKAVKEAIAKRPTPADEADAGLTFITKYGRRFVRTNRVEVKPGEDPKPERPIDGVAQEFSKVLRKLGLKRAGSFYNLRHVFETIAGDSKDQVAVDAVMGHADDSMSAAYRERISDERLRGVVNVVRKWLFGVK